MASQEVAASYNIRKLRDLLVECFNEEELRDLCFSLGADYEQVVGSNATKAQVAREIVLWFNRNDRLEDCIDRCRELRPDNEWDAVYIAVAPIPGSRRVIGLAGLLKQPQIAQYVAAFDQPFAEFEKTLTRTHDYKELHDAYHGLMFSYLMGMLDGTTGMDKRTLMQQERAVQVYALQKSKIAERTSFTPAESARLISLLERMQAALSNVVNTSNTARFKLELQLIARDVDFELVSANRALTTEAWRLHDKASLRDSIARLRDVVAKETRDADLISQFDSGLSGIDDLRKKLYGLVSLHILLQDIHNDLVLLRANPAQYLWPGSPNWELLSCRYAEVCAITLIDPTLDKPIQDHKAAGETLTRAIGDKRADDVPAAFSAYDQVAEMLFFSVDSALTNYLARLVGKFLPLLKDVRETIHGRAI